MRSDDELLALLRASLERGDISLHNGEVNRIYDLAEMGRDVAVLDARAIENGTNVPQVQHGLRNARHDRLWEMFLWLGDERTLFQAESPAKVRRSAVVALLAREEAK